MFAFFRLELPSGKTLKLAISQLLLSSIIVLGCTTQSATDDSGDDSESDPNTTETLAAPTGVSGTGYQESVLLTWDTVDDATSYDIYYADASIKDSTDLNGDATLIEDISPPYSHEGLTNGTEYFYLVVAKNDSNESDPSDEVSVTAGLSIASLSLDSNLSACIDGTGAVYTGDLTTLSCSDTITNLDDLDEFTELTSLSLTNLTGITSLAPFSNLENLTSLTIDSVTTDNVGPLASLESLTDLAITGTGTIDNLDPITGLTTLTSLSLDGFTITDDLSQLNELMSLDSLTVSGAGISDISFINDGGPSLIGLTSLDLSDNNIDDVTDIALLTSLTSLSLADNSVATGGLGLAALTALTGAGSLNLTGNSTFPCGNATVLDDDFDGGDGDSAGIVIWGTCAATPSWSTDVFPILSGSCTGCHNGGFDPDFTVGAATAYTNYVDVASGTGGWDWFEPGSASTSYIYIRMAELESTSVMPPGGSLGNPSLTTIQQWLDAGAADD